MVLAEGARVGPYEVLSRIASDDDGDLYRARDSKHSRVVALRVLPEWLTRDAAARIRLRQMAPALAALDHPHLAAFYTLEDPEGVCALATELIEGPSLADRLDAGPIPVAEALEIARQIAEGLESTHAHGFVHRRLRPRLVQLSDRGRVKLLEAGLSDVLGREPTRGSADGTSYRSPEQERGRPVDRQADVWAFGAIVFEMLSGTPAFGSGGRAPGAILTREPDWAALPTATPPSAERVVRRCLERNPYQRLHDIADARIEIEHARTEPASSESRGRPTPARALAWKLFGSFLLGGLAAGVALWIGLRPSPRRPARPERLNIQLPAMAPLVGEGLPVAVLSPDGSRLVYVASQGDRSILYLRQLDRIEAKPIAGTEGAVSPFFSPDGEWVGFQAEGRLKKIPVAGGQAAVLCDAPQLRGASWGADGTILFAADLEGGLSRVSSEGGLPQPVTKLVAGSGQTSHRWPQILPGGKAAVFSTLTSSGREEEREIVVVQLDSGQTRTLLRGGTYPRYESSGHLLYTRGSSVMAAPFDPKRLDLTGAGVSVLENVRSAPNGSGVALFDVSSAGSLIFLPADTGTATRSLLWVDRKGQTRPVTRAQRAYAHPALSPDGKKLAVVIHGTADDIWIGDLETDAWRRLTFEADNQEPIWSPDGKRIVFSSNRKGNFNLYTMLAEGTSPPDLLFSSEDWVYPNSFSPDGSLVAASEQTRAGYDIALAPASGGAPRPYLASPLEELMPRFSPDGKWIAYVLRESGKADVCVRPYPGPGERLLVSTRGGDEPAWSPDGKELFYREAGRLMAARVRTEGGGLSASAPEVVFEGLFDPGNDFVNYDVSRDGRLFVVVKGPAAAPLQIVVVPDWAEELESRLEPPRR